jgi:hypothetical protein
MIMTRQIFILLFSLLVFGHIYSQRIKINLDANVFRKSIANTAWSLEDKTKKQAEEIFLMSFKQNILSIAYVDWIEGMYGSDTKYKLAFKDSIMEITPISWKSTKGSSKKKEKNPPFVIYCYLRSFDKLVVLFKDKKIELSPKLLEDKEWVELVKFEK